MRGEGVRGEKRGKPGTDGKFSRVIPPVARLPQVVAVDVAQHVTRRGNGRQLILATDSARMVYLDLLGQAVQLHGMAVVGYCLISNHEAIDTQGPPTSFAETVYARRIDQSRGKGSR